MKFSKYHFIYLLLVFLFTVTGCSNETGITKTTIDSIDSKEVLKLDPNADIFKFDGVIYKTNIEWVEKLSLTKNIQIGEIKKRNQTNTNFKNEMLNKLPVGAKIFSAKERSDILIVESDGKLLISCSRRRIIFIVIKTEFLQLAGTFCLLNKRGSLAKEGFINVLNEFIY